MRDVIFVDAESGDLVLQNRPEMDIVRVGSYRQVSQFYEWLKKHLAARDADDRDALLALDAMVRPEGEEPKLRKYKTVIVDSLTEIQKYNFYQIMGIDPLRQRLDVEPEKAQFAEWQKTVEMIRLLVRGFRDLPIHVIFVLSERESEGENKRATIGLNLPGSLARELPGFLDLVGYYDIVRTNSDRNNPQQERRLYITAGNGFLAKNRFVGFKDPYILEPTMAKLEALVQKD